MQVTYNHDMCTQLNNASYGKTLIANAGGAYGHMTCQSHSMDDASTIKTFSSMLLRVFKKIRCYWLHLLHTKLLPWR